MDFDKLKAILVEHNCLPDSGAHPVQRDREDPLTFNEYNELTSEVNERLGKIAYDFILDCFTSLSREDNYKVETYYYFDCKTWEDFWSQRGVR